MRVPDVIFKIREGDIAEDGGCSFKEGKWVEKTTEDIFNNKKVILFSLPGAFTPTCTSKQLPGFEENYQAFKDLGIDEIYCISVNDSFSMNMWACNESIKNVKVLPDGNGEFTSGMNMLVDKSNLGFGQRSWRYAAIINDGVIKKMFEEPGKIDNCPTDPYGESSPENVLKYLQSTQNGNKI
jgi:peroxiredoxin